MIRESRRSPLAGAAAFEAVLRSGRRRDGDYLQVIAMAAARDRGRAGFVIGRKALPRAVDRNRIRRMLRVALREACPAIDAYDLIVRLKRRAPRADFPLLVTEVVQLLGDLAPRQDAP